MIKSVIFDFDGLICDTETPELKAWESIFDDLGYSFPTEEYLKSIGSIYNDLSPLKFLKKISSKEIDMDAIAADFKSRKIELIDQEPLMPCIQQYLDDAKSINMNIGLASSSPFEWIDHHLRRLNIMDYFDCIITANDVQKTKPDPALFIKAAQSLNSNPEEVLALEDSINGVTAALRAGIYVVVVPNPVTANFNFNNAHLVISSLCELPLKSLLHMFDNLPL